MSDNNFLQDECSFVSLRDTVRACVLFDWFLMMLTDDRTGLRVLIRNEEEKEQNESGDHIQVKPLLLYHTSTLLCHTHCYTLLAVTPTPPSYFRANFLYKVILPPLHAPSPPRGPLESVCSLRHVHIYTC